MFANIKKKSNKQFRKKNIDEEGESNEPTKIEEAPQVTQSTNGSVDKEEKKEDDDEFEKKVKARTEKLATKKTSSSKSKTNSKLSFEEVICQSSTLLFKTTYDNTLTFVSFNSDIFRIVFGPSNSSSGRSRK